MNDRYVLRGDLNLGLGTLRVEEGALASAKEIVVGTTRGYDSHLIATGAGSRVTSNFLSVGTDLRARSRWRLKTARRSAPPTMRASATVPGRVKPTR